MPFEEGLARLNGHGTKLTPSSLFGDVSKREIEFDEHMAPQLFPCFSGTLAAHMPFGVPLPAEIVYKDPHTEYLWVIPVPKEHQGKQNALLVTEPGDYRIDEHGMTRIIVASRLDAVEGFPKSTGWYNSDPEHGMPTGNQVTDPKSLKETSRRLHRIDQYVGPVVHVGDEPRAVHLDFRPSLCFGFFVT